MLQALASAPEEEVLRLWSGLGYYSRARNLQKAAQQIVREHGGEFPRERGRDSRACRASAITPAAAILSIAFGEKHAVLDGNVARVLARLGAIRGDLREGAALASAARNRGCTAGDQNHPATGIRP